MMVLSVLGEQKVRRITFGGVERLVKVLTGFLEAKEMADASGSGVYRALLFRLELSPMGMGGRFKVGLPKPTGKGLLKK